MKKYQISRQTMRYFLESGLTIDHAREMQIRDVGAQELKKLFPKWKFGDDISAHEIPYLDLSGSPTGYARYRLHCDDGSFPKYLQPSGQKSRLYFPPFLDWEKIAPDPTIPLIITEGGRKAAKACIMGFPCIGIGGVWNWVSKTDEQGYK